ncbi:hypothetical protein DU002_04755 [Corallincola holothuriorum]|uniref:Thioredoxin domain-containing protein n=1 Tax=Corallincola holothuriorum TaxID=2282215 RepID=A0A368NMH5_9GAMM|nr:hypothetical protein [Corallincola holothuriorum]RCU51782.1 hypothetical protein DU002_04755 [Corallincola holothuriorum]
MIRFLFTPLLLSCVFQTFAADNQPETNPLVTSGIFTRVNPGEVMAHLDEESEKSPLYIFMGLDGKGCVYCANSQKMLEGMTDQFDLGYRHIYVGFNSLREINDYPELKQKFFISGLPAFYVYYDKQFANMHSGSFGTEKDAENFWKFGKWNIQNTTGSVFHTVKSEPDLAAMQFHSAVTFYRYGGARGYKALAMTVSGYKFKFGEGRSEASQEEADLAAMDDCKKYQPKQAKMKCKLVASGNQIIPDIFNPDITERLALYISLKKK